MKKAVVILSGGLDSTTLLYDIGHKGYEIKALSFDYGQRHKKELEFAKKTCKMFGIEHKILDLKILGEIAPSTLTRKGVDWRVPEGYYEDDNMKATVVPNRNMVMLSLAISYAIGNKINKVFYGAHAGDHAIYPDCRPEFVDGMKNVAKLCDWNKISIGAPYLNMDKAQILKKGLKIGVDYSKTWTCYNGRKKACGKCGSCQERLEAFAKNKVLDPLEYED